MNFQTEYNRAEVVYTNPGTKFIDKYQEAPNSKGQTILKKVGSTNVYEKIQASLEETKTYNILEKYYQSGDSDILMQRECIFGDFTNVPKTPLELHEVIIRAGEQFEALDKDVRAAFDNDVGIFKQSILDGSFESRVEKFRPKKNVAPVQTTVEPEAPVQTEQTTNTTTGGVNLNE